MVPKMGRSASAGIMRVVSLVSRRTARAGARMTPAMVFACRGVSRHCADEVPRLMTVPCTPMRQAPSLVLVHTSLDYGCEPLNRRQPRSQSLARLAAARSGPLCSRAMRADQQLLDTALDNYGAYALSLLVHVLDKREREAEAGSLVQNALAIFSARLAQIWGVQRVSMLDAWAERDQGEAEFDLAFRQLLRDLAWEGRASRLLVLADDHADGSREREARREPAVGSQAISYVACREFSAHLRAAAEHYHPTAPVRAEYLKALAAFAEVSKSDSMSILGEAEGRTGFVCEMLRITSQLEYGRWNDVRGHLTDEGTLR